MIELVAATLILSVALLALIGAYSFGFFAISSSGKTSAAGLLANNQLELYSALPYASIGLDATTLTSVQSTDATYSTDESGLPGTGTDVTISSCGSTAQCSPVQTLTGPDNKSYKLETFIRLVANPIVSTRSEKVVTVIVRNAGAAGTAKVLTMQTAFDTGSASSSPPAVTDCSAGGSNCESLLVDKTVVNNTTLTIGYTDDSAMQTTGSYAPTAFLNGVQQLSVIPSTPGSALAQNYVDTYGGTAGTTHQSLLTITLPSGLAPGSYTVLITVRDSNGSPLDTDQYSWPITVASNGTVTG
jgi:hypothetical protein